MPHSFAFRFGVTMRTTIRASQEFVKRTLANLNALLVAALVAVLVGALAEGPAACAPAQPPATSATPDAAAVAAPGTPAPSSHEPYVFAAASADGIGKLYFGREIAHVMGHEAADWLDRPERVVEERTDLLLDLLDLTQDLAVADIGAGSGTLTFPIARRAARGRVFAVDIQPEMLTLLRERAAAEHLTNVEPVLGAIDDVKLPAASVDLVLLVDSYHEFSHPREMLASIVHSLKHGGRVAQVEYRGEDASVPIKPLHKMTEAQARREFEAAGLRWLRTREDLPRQHVILYERP